MDLGPVVSNFLMLWPFNTLPQVAGTPSHRTFFFFCYFITVMNATVMIQIVNIWYVTPLKGSLAWRLSFWEQSEAHLCSEERSRAHGWCLVTSTWICLSMKWDGTGPMRWLSGQGCLPPRFFQLSGIPGTHVGHGENQHQQISSDIHTFTLAHILPDTQHTLNTRAYENV